MRVEEAKKKNCCCPRIVGWALEKSSGDCVGDDCMAWRWVQGQFDPLNVTKEEDMRGYCGLAGKP